MGLLFKWIWRFLNNESDLWISLVKSIYGVDGGIGPSPSRPHYRSTWNSILCAIKRLKVYGIDLLSYCKRMVGNGISTRFWYDVWCGNQPLNVQFPRIFCLDLDKNCSIASRVAIPDWHLVLRRPPRGGAEFSQMEALITLIGTFCLSDKSDYWSWSLGGIESFSVASVRSLVDAVTLGPPTDVTPWNNCLPIKVNVFVWRLMLNKLPTRFNLDRRNINVDSLLCPNCLVDIETSNHIFF